MVKTCLPVLIIKDIILFPQSEVRLEIDKEKDKELIALAESYYNKHILIVHQKNLFEKNFDVNDLPPIATLGTINMKIDLPNNKTRVVIRGINRVSLKTLEKEEDNIYLSEIEPIVVEQLDELEEMAYSRSLKRQIEHFIDNNSHMSNSIMSNIMGINDINKLTDILALAIPGTYERKLQYLYEINPTVRATMILDDISQELKIIKLENELDERVGKNLEEAQKEYVLQEKLKVIKEELGISFDKDSEVEELRGKIIALEAPDKVKTRLLNELKRFEATPSTSPEIAIIRNYIDCLLSVPWTNKSVDTKDLNKALQLLNKTHYGLNNIKQHIIEYLALIKMTNNLNSPIICLVGPPGVGKTSLAKSIANAMNRKFTKISVGGINDEAEIIGHRKAYIGSSCGRIISGMKKAGTINPVFVIDEIDKMTKDIKGDPASSLLEVLDKEQNTHFYDNYLEEEYDLSNVMFICTANYKEQIPRELYDRLEIIELSSYTEYEKLHIAKKHIIPNNIKTHGLIEKKVTFTDQAILKIINNYTKEAGVRELERLISNILRKIIKNILIEKNKKTYKIDAKDIASYLGNERYLYHDCQLKKEIGLVNAMSYNIYGGDILPVEVNYYPGNGSIITTGNLGEVFVESAKIALSYIKSNYTNFNIDYALLKNNDIHIHVPEGAIKKDGPSAGVALTTAIISALTNNEIPCNISMTGEITLRGNVLAIGGLKEKIIGAKRAGIKTIYLPKENSNDLKEIDDEIKKDLKFILVENYQEIAKELNL